MYLSVIMGAASRLPYAHRRREVVSRAESEAILAVYQRVCPLVLPSLPYLRPTNGTAHC